VTARNEAPSSKVLKVLGAILVGVVIALISHFAEYRTGWFQQTPKADQTEPSTSGGADGPPANPTQEESPETSDRGAPPLATDTPPANPVNPDDLALKLAGTKGAKVLSIDKGESGAIAEDATREYIFSGRYNIPLLFKMEQTAKHFWANVEVHDAAGLTLRRDGFTNRTGELAFTPPQDGAYSLVLKGTRNFGEFVIVMSYLDRRGTDQSGAQGAFSPEGRATGVMAENAVREYRFAGRENQPLLFTMEQTSEHFWANVSVVDSEGQTLKRDDFVSNRNELIFTPQKNDYYSLVLTGTRTMVSS